MVRNSFVQKTIHPVILPALTTFHDDVKETLQTMGIFVTPVLITFHAYIAL
jgi:hypothetical protein